MAIPKSPLADVISEHWKSLLGQSIEVAEWSDGDNKTIIHFDPVTLEERQGIAEFTGGEMLVEVIILKAKNEEGQKLFSKADKPKLMKAASAAVIVRIANLILAGDYTPVKRLGEP